jgi:hypothetical protein
VAAAQPRDHGAVVAFEEGDAHARRDRPGDVVHAEVELPGQAVGHRARLDGRVKARDRSVSLGSGDGAPELRLLPGPRLGLGRLPGQPAGSQSDERTAHDGQGDGNRCASSRPPRKARETDEPDPGEHAAHRRGLDEVARDSGIPERGGHDRRQRPAEDHERQRAHGAIAGSPPEDQRGRGTEPHRCRGDADGAAQELEPRVAAALQGSRLAAELCTVQRVQRVTRADPVGHDPQRDHGREPDGQRPPAPLGSPQEARVPGHEEPHLWAPQPGKGAEKEGRVASAS